MARPKKGESRTSSGGKAAGSRNRTAKASAASSGSAKKKNGGAAKQQQPALNERGKRSKVALVSQDPIPRSKDDGLEDPDAVFDAARSPVPENDGSNDDNDDDETMEEEEVMEKSKKKKTTLPSKKKKMIRFSLDAQAQQQSETDMESLASSRGGPGRIYKKVQFLTSSSSQASRESMSPSNLSAVSTAATPVQKVDKNNNSDDEDDTDDGQLGGDGLEHENEDDDMEVEQDDDEEEQLSTPKADKASPEPKEDDDDDTEDDPVSSSAVKDSTPQAPAMDQQPQDGDDDDDDQDDGFPVPVADDDSHGNDDDDLDDDDDLIPPPPPDSPEREDANDDDPMEEDAEEQQQPQDEEEEQQQAAAAKVPTQDGGGAVMSEEEEDDDMAMQASSPNDDDDDDPPPPQDDNESLDDDDDDKEGPGFEMARTPKTPASSIRRGRFSQSSTGSSVQQQEEEAPTKKKQKKKRRNDNDDDKNKKKKKRKRGVVSSEDSDEEEQDLESTSTPQSAVVVAKKKKKKAVSRFATRFSPKGIRLPQEFETIPVSELKDDDETPPEGLRRSRRARVAPLAFWKNEKPEYGANDDEDAGSDLINMPVVKGYIRALDTPYKPRRVPPRPKVSSKGGKKNGGGGKTTVIQKVVKQSEPFDSSRLRGKLEVIDGEEGRLWDDNVEEATDMKIVAYKSRMESRKLPLVKTRTKAEGKVVGKAAQAFNVPNGAKEGYAGYIMGNLTLPPKGIKDAESVGSCSQTFTVVSGQPGALEIAYADPEEDENGNLSPETALRYLLSPGDMFRVPPGNCYRLQNHSKSESCFLTWTIIRPVALENMHQEGGTSPISSPATSAGGHSR